MVVSGSVSSSPAAGGCFGVERWACTLLVDRFCSLLWLLESCLACSILEPCSPTDMDSNSRSSSAGEHLLRHSVLPDPRSGFSRYLKKAPVRMRGGRQRHDLWRADQPGR